MKKVIYSKTCLICFKPFQASQHTAKCCSAKCRQALYLANRIMGINADLARVTPVWTPEATSVKASVVTPVVTPVVSPVVTHPTVIENGGIAEQQARNESPLINYNPLKFLFQGIYK